MIIQTSNLKEHFQNQTYDVKKIFEEFKKPILQNVFFRNLTILKQNSEFIKFTQDRWTYRPQIFCKDIYEEPEFSQIILLVNNIYSFIDFHPANLKNNVIIAPYRHQIITLLSYST